MARTNGQIIINYHTSGTALPSAGNVELGEVVVLHNPDKAELVIKDNNGGLHEFVDSAAVVTMATEVAGKAVDGFAEVSAQTLANKAAIEAHQTVYEALYSATTANTEAIRVLNADAATETSVDNKISNFSALTEAAYVKKVEGKALSTNDLTDDLKESYDNAVLSAHSHDNKTVLDGITAEKVENWDKAVQAAGVKSIGEKTGAITLKGGSTTAGDVNLSISESGEISAAIVDGKYVEAVAGKGLSTNDYDATAVAEVAKIADKVDKVDGKGLSTNDYDATAVAEVAKIANKVDKETGKSLVADTEITKLAGIEAGAQVNVIEKVKVNDAELTVTDKTVNIVIPDAVKYKLVEATTTEGALKSYKLVADGNDIADSVTIDLAKDLVVTAGEVVTNPEGQTAGTYLKLTIANQEKPVFINVKDLVDVYTGDNTTIEVSDANVISVKDGVFAAASHEHSHSEINDWDTEMAKKQDALANAAEVAKISDGDVAKWNAKQDAIAENTYDAYGAADGVKTTLEGTAADTKDSATIAGAKKYADSLVKDADGNSLFDAAGAAADVDAKFANYATSADTVAAIEAANTEALKNYATSADTVAAIEKKQDVLANANVLTGITADQVTAWDEAEANVITGITYNGTAVTVTDKVAAIKSYVSSIDNTDSIDLTVTDGKLTAAVKKIDGGSF